MQGCTVCDLPSESLECTDAILKGRKRRIDEFNLKKAFNKKGQGTGYRRLNSPVGAGSATCC